MSTLDELVAMLQDPNNDRSQLCTAADNLHKMIEAFVESRVGPGSRKRKWTQRSKTSLPAELLLDVFRFLDRDALDRVHWASKQFSELVRANESSELALRRIAKVSVGKECRRDGCDNCARIWLSVCKINVDNTRPKRSFKSAVDLRPYLRMSYVEELKLNVEPSGSDNLLRLFYDDLCRIEHLDFPSATIRDVRLQTRDYPDESLGCLRKLHPESLIIAGNWRSGEAEFLPDDHFFKRIASSGVKRLEIDTWCYDPIPTKSLLAFCFGEPVRSGRYLLLDPRSAGYAARNLMRLIRKRASQLDRRRSHDCWFTISGVRMLNVVGQEKYKFGENSYIIDDLDNKVKLEIAHKDNTELEVHVTSSSDVDNNDTH